MTDENRLPDNDRTFAQIIDAFKIKIYGAGMEENVRERCITALDHMDTVFLHSLYAKADTNLSSQSLMYICAFLCGFTTSDISVIFKVEPESVYRIKYRIKKSFPKDIFLPF